MASVDSRRYPGRGCGPGSVHRRRLPTSEAPPRQREDEFRLAEILSDAIADKKMTRITWIIIVLIVLSILVTCSEVFLRFGILAKVRHSGTGVNVLGMEESLGAAELVKLPTTTPRNFARIGLVASWVLVGASLL